MSTDPRSAGRSRASDLDLLAGIADADRGALHAFFDRHQPWLAARLRQRCSDPAIVAEVVNDTFPRRLAEAGRLRRRG